jgi:hypothetical protein
VFVSIKKNLNIFFRLETFSFKKHLKYQKKRKQENARKKQHEKNEEEKMST